jgi:hypothetical protein
VYGISSARTRLRRRHEVAPPELGRIEAEVARDQIEHALGDGRSDRVAHRPVL